jgi:hypothetical protein
MKHRSLAAITFGLALLAGAGFAQSPTQYDLGGDAAPLPAGDGAYWWKGNLHTHTLWSDADQFPEVSADWYHSHGYHFLQLSDHNTMLRGDRWIEPASHGSIRGAQGDTDYSVLNHYIERFGTDWVETRINESGNTEVRLKTLDELRTLFEKPGRFLMIEGEELTDSMSVHVIATNLAEFIPTQGGTMRETDVNPPVAPYYANPADSPYFRIRNNIEAVYEQRAATGRPMIPHLAHPNWYQHLTAEDIMPVEKLRFFEVYNGHRGVRNYGEAAIHIQPVERIWDILLTKRLAELDLGALYALAVDDSHHYAGSVHDTAQPGRGWIMVRSKFLTPEHLIAAMERGDFYASNGVTLRSVTSDDKQYTVEVEPEDGVTYTIDFIGTRQGYDPTSEPILDADGKELRATRRYSNDIGVVLQSTDGTSATYTFSGDEIYVRAKVTSSKEKANPFAHGEKEMAWTQPVVVVR